MVYINGMNRTIRVTSDNENKIRENLLQIGKEKESEVKAKFHLPCQLFSEVFFATLSNEKLGTFFKDGKYIVLNESLINSNIDKKAIENIFLHEVAHALDYAINNELSGHSAKFRDYCDMLGVEKGFDKAQIKKKLIDQEKNEQRITKLMALSTSPFENEAMIALSKAQKLMLEMKDVQKEEDEEKIYISDLYEGKKIALYVSKICSFVSKATGVFIVKCKQDDSSVIRCYGNLPEVEFALYLFDYILDSINKEVKKLRKEGFSITKDGFVVGAIPEMENKLWSLDSNTRALIVATEKENAEKANRLVFKNKLRTIKYGSRNLSKQSYDLGSSFAKKLEIPKKINQRKICK